MTKKFINISKARTHNLKNISLKIPKDELVVFTGPSGSGKSSLAFDTIYSEGQRRYIESLSSYAKQFINQFAPPDVDSISGLSPTLAIDQKTINKNPRSTVGTITEIHDYLRLLFSKIGIQHCPKCKDPIIKQTSDQITKKILTNYKNLIIEIWAPIAIQKKGEFKNELLKLFSQGIYKIKINGEVTDLNEETVIDKNKKNNILIFIDKLIIKESSQKRLFESVEFALKTGSGQLHILSNENEVYFSENRVCLKCNTSFPELDPKVFSFNSPLGACHKCNGLGLINDFNLNLIFPDKTIPFDNGGVTSIIKKNSFFYQMLKAVAKEEQVSLSLPFIKFPPFFQEILINGSEKKYFYSFVSDNSNFNFKKEFPGIIGWLNKKLNEGCSEKTRLEINQLTETQTCSLCKGYRLKENSQHVFINQKNIASICEASIENIYDFFDKLKLSAEEKAISDKILKEIISRIGFLKNVGLNYLNLNRSAMTLSGGEAQRIRLASQIGTSLTGVIYVLDEPSIGLHARDNSKLIKTLKELRDIGNSVIVVEHDEETISSADHIIELGVGAGKNGGEIVFQGPFNKIKKTKKSITGRFLSGKELIPIPLKRRNIKNFIKIEGANKNNIQNQDFKIPLEALVAITGVSGSGKSTLVHNILVPSIKAYFSKNKNKTAERINCKKIENLNLINNIIELDQSPIGRTPKSNPATYTGVFDHIRKIFATTKDSRIRGYQPGRFSFNIKGGRCDFCEGNGQIKIEMHFLADVFIPCSECQGKRYNNETLSILYKGKSISDVLEASIAENCDFFKNYPHIYNILNNLVSVGLGYMPLGQSATTLSGGEAQRLKLARELSKNTKEKCLYLLDEPTTGLHFYDIKILLSAINHLVNNGHSVVVIEHNMDVIKSADYIIDLGPEGGNKGGLIVGEGKPEDFIKNKNSYTAKYLKKYLSPLS